MSQSQKCTYQTACELLNVRLIKHPLIEHKLTILRDRGTDPFQFRMLVDEISYLMMFEATRDLALREVSVHTPVAQTAAYKLATKIMICPILRAALGMLDSVFKLIPDASVGFLGFQRDEKTAQAEFFYAKLPADATERTAIIIDPMFATATSSLSTPSLSSLGTPRNSSCSRAATASTTSTCSMPKAKSYVSSPKGRLRCWKYSVSTPKPTASFSKAMLRDISARISMPSMSKAEEPPSSTTA